VVVFEQSRLPPSDVKEQQRELLEEVQSVLVWQ
jgi:hypothetical protein